MRRLLLFVICCFALGQYCYAQDQLTGRVYENKTKVFLQNIRVENLKTHAMTMTAQDGSFTINAIVGDRISFSNYNYKTDTLFLTELRYVQIFLDPRVTVLQEVTVKNQELKGNNNGFSTQAEKGVFGTQGVTYQRDSSGNYKGGVNFNIPDGQDTKRIHETRVAADEKEKAGILKVFNAVNLKKYLPITGQEMDNFIILYMPDVNTYYAPGFNLVGYLNGCFEEFNKIPVEQRQSKELTQLKAKE